MIHLRPLSSAGPFRGVVASVGRHGAALLVLSVALAAGCRCDNKTIGLSSGVLLVTPAGPTTQVTRSINLGNVRVTNLATYDIKLHNIGRVAANIHAGFATESPNFFLKMAGGTNGNDTVASDADYHIELRYQPDKVGADTTTIVITTTAATTPKYTIDVKANGAESQIDVCSTDDGGGEICFSTAPANKLVVNMGKVVPGSSATKPLVIKNAGGLKLAVSTIAPTSNTSQEFTVGPDQGPVGVDPAMSAQYHVQYSPETGGPEEGVMEITSDDPVNPDILVYIEGTGDAPHLCVNPTSVQYGDVPVNTTAHQTVTITSCGTEAVTLNSLTAIDISPQDMVGMTPLYAVASALDKNSAAVSFPKTLAANDYVTVDLAFSPVAIGDATGHLSFPSNSPGQEHAFVPLDGNGVGCSLTPAPGSVSFGSVSTSGHGSRNVVVTNNGTAPCTITSEATSGDPFAVTNAPTMSVTVQPGQTQVVTVTFSPTTASSTAATGSLIIGSNALTGDLTIPLSGTGIVPPPCDLEPDPSSISFTGVSSGQTATTNVTINNFGTATCDVAGVVVQSVNNGPTADFQAAMGQNMSGVPNFVPVMIAPGASATLKVTFTPSSTANQAVNISLYYAEDSNPSVTLCGILGSCASLPGHLIIPATAGVIQPAICLVPPALDFGTVAVGQSKDLSFAIQSCGAAGSVLELRGARIETGTSPAFTISSAVNVPQYLASGQSLNVVMHYVPVTGNGDFGQVSVLTNDPMTPKALEPLKGNASTVCAKQLSCSPPKLTFPTTEDGRTESLSAVCLNVGNQPVTVSGTSFTAQTSGAFSASAGRTPLTIAPGTSARIEVDYTPQQAGTDTGTLLVGSDACQQPTVALQGSGKIPNYPPCLPPQNFSPVTKWYWTGAGAAIPGSNNVAMSPIVVNLDDDNHDGRIDVNDIPEVLFTTCSAGNCAKLNLTDMSMSDISGIGMLRAIHGQNGSHYFDVTDANLQLGAVTQIATADLDGDNLPEIIAVKHTFRPGTGMGGFLGKYVDGTLLVFDHTGKLEFETDHWTGDPNAGEFGSAPAIADLDGDGHPEIVFERTVFHYDGTKWYDMAASGNWGHGAFPTLSDLDGDGHPEIISGAYVYHANGTLMWMAPGSGATCDPTQLTACISIANGGSQGICDPVTKTCIMPSGPTMVLDMNGDGKPEVVLRDGSQSVHVLDGATGHVLASATWPPIPSSGEEDDNSICPAAMSAADLDNDGKAELIIPAGNFIYTFKYDGSSTLQPMWQAPIDDYGGQCGASGSAAFDFEGNGKYDVVYHDTQFLYAFRGTDGTLIYETPRSSDTIFETPVIADIDNDGHADLIMTNDGADISGVSGNLAGVKALSNAGNTWPATRRIWSDHAYHISEITDDATVPRVESPNYSNRTTNSWRSQAPLCTPH